MVSKNWFQTNYKKKTREEKRTERIELERQERTQRNKEYVEKTFERGELLDLNYPVYYDYMYYADDTWVKSDIQGTVRDLIYDLHFNRKINVKNIYACRYK